ncbi:hypothetical protein RRG08_016098 [Elysia crispata]|uniref:Uncharacterized protein n=1 Tax=Elysia crispata TaxID=231223 RepID=A0AAE0ZNY5_9GAST|nr:hypothetical protein RRG08_016098 [Elysia crispata]
MVALNQRLKPSTVRIHNESGDGSIPEPSAVCLFILRLGYQALQLLQNSRFSRCRCFNLPDDTAPLASQAVKPLPRPQASENIPLPQSAARLPHIGPGIDPAPNQEKHTLCCVKCGEQTFAQALIEEEGEEGGRRMRTRTKPLSQLVSVEATSLNTETDIKQATDSRSQETLLSQKAEKLRPEFDMLRLQECCYCQLSKLQKAEEMRPEFDIKLKKCAPSLTCRGFKIVVTANYLNSRKLKKDAPSLTCRGFKNVVTANCSNSRKLKKCAPSLTCRGFKIVVTANYLNSRKLKKYTPSLTC